MELLYKDEVYAVIGAAMEVYNNLGPGFLEAVYQEAMDKLTSREESQILNYLKATGMKVGLVINFGAHNDLEWKRLVFTQTKQPRVYRPVNVLKKIGED